MLLSLAAPVAFVLTTSAFFGIVRSCTRRLFFCQIRSGVELLHAAERDSNRAFRPRRLDLRLTGLNPVVVFQAAAKQAKSIFPTSPELFSTTVCACPTDCLGVTTRLLSGFSILLPMAVVVGSVCFGKMTD